MADSIDSLAFTLSSWLRAIEAGDHASARLLQTKSEQDAKSVVASAQLRKCVEEMSGNTLEETIERIEACLRRATEAIANEHMTT